MSTAIMGVYDAVREAGASEGRSRAAAEAVAGFETRCPRVEADTSLLKWMAGFDIALSVAMPGILLRSVGT
jgi:hypothetical protein